MSRLKDETLGCWVLTGGSQELGFVVPDDHVPGMCRTIDRNGRVSEMMTLGDAKDALVEAASGLKWQKEQRRESPLPAGWTKILRAPKRAEA